MDISSSQTGLSSLPSKNRIDILLSMAYRLYRFSMSFESSKAIAFGASLARIWNGSRKAGNPYAERGALAHGRSTRFEGFSYGRAGARASIASFRNPDAIALPNHHQKTAVSFFQYPEERLIANVSTRAFVVSLIHSHSIVAGGFPEMS
jgi:hypothetical protein